MKPTKEEAIKDLELNTRDIEALHQILQGMRQFANTDQDRYLLRSDMMRYQDYLDTANRLQDKITEYVKSLSQP